jgi:hypothetical protein
MAERPDIRDQVTDGHVHARGLLRRDDEGAQDSAIGGEEKLLPTAPPRSLGEGWIHHTTFLTPFCFKARKASLTM